MLQGFLDFWKNNTGYYGDGEKISYSVGTFLALITALVVPTALVLGVIYIL